MPDTDPGVAGPGPGPGAGPAPGPNPARHTGQSVAGSPVPPLAPEPDAESEGFWQGTEVGELRVQACGSCGSRRFPPLVRCAICHSVERTWRPVSGEGEVWSFVVPHPPLLPGFAEAAPYNVVVVSLAEDPTLRMVGNLVARAGGPIGEVDPATVEIGLPVRVVFTERRSPSGRRVWVPQWMRRERSR